MTDNSGSVCSAGIHFKYDCVTGMHDQGKLKYYLPCVYPLALNLHCQTIVRVMVFSRDLLNAFKENVKYLCIKSGYRHTHATIVPQDSVSNS